MGKFTTTILPHHREFIEKQQMFFTATAPLGESGHVNLSPKGMGGFRVLNLTKLGEWYHLAAVSGKGGMKLYLNGVLVGTNSFKGSFADGPKGENNWLGRFATAQIPAQELCTECRSG